MATENATERSLTDLLFERAGAGLCLVAPDGTVVRANSEWLRSTGFEEGQVVGEDIIGLFPATRDMAVAMHARARAGHRVEVPRHAQVVNGRETWWEGSIEPVAMEGGTGLLIFAREVSEALAVARAEAARRETKEIPRHLVENLNSAVIVAEPILDADGRLVDLRYLSANPAVWKHLGKAPGELVGKRYSEVFHHPGRNPVFDVYERVLSTGEPYHGELLLPATGRYFDVAAFRPRPGRLALSLSDVTDRKRAQDALAAEKERYRGLFEHSLDAVYLARADGTILDANLAACRLHGMTVEEIRAAGRAGLVVMDERHQAAIRARATAGSAWAEMTVRRKGGGRVPVEVQSVLLDPTRPAESDAFVISRDLSARKRVEEALRRSEQKYAALFDHAPVAIALIRHPEGTLVEINDAYERMFGCSRAEAVGRTAVELGLVADTGRRDRMYAAVREHGFVRDFECGYLTRTGSAGVALFSFDLVEIEGERFQLGTAVDITDRKRFEEALHRANQRLNESDRRKDEFLGMLSHELRNPLAPIRNALYILDRARPGGLQAQRARDIANRQVAHLTRLVDDLLDVTRIARGKIELRRERLDLAALALRTAEDYRPLMQDRGLDLAMELPRGPVTVTGDPARLTQILGNLLGNAAKFTPGGGRVTLSMARVEGRAVVRVRDTGPGIPDDVLPTLFEPFTQGKQTLARSEGGLGLGLSLVKGLVSLHGGDVAATTAPGGGAQLVVRLPLANEAGAEPSPAPRTAAAGPRRRVLVVDDNRDGADTVADLARMLGHEVEVAYDGFGALAKVAERVPDVVLCDIGLPGMDGYELARQLRARAGAAPVRLVAVSGYARPEDVARALASGFDAHLAKPADPATLAQLLA